MMHVRIVVLVALVASAAAAAPRPRPRELHTVREGARLRLTMRRDNETVPATPYNERWMEQLFPVIANRTLYDLTLPGTHDSGAYVLFDELIAGPGLERLIDLAEELGIPVYDLIDGWSVCQTRTFYEQLAGGIRSLDFRAAWDGVEWRTIHGLLGVSVQLLLDDIRAFLDTHPREIVHILLGNFAGSSSGDALRQNLFDQIEATLGRYMIPVTPDHVLRRTVAELVEANHRALVIHPDANDLVGRTLFWHQPLCDEGRYSNKNNVDEMVAYNTDMIKRLGGNNKLFTVSWTLTPQVEDIIRGLPPAAGVRTLYELVRPGNERLDSYFRETTTLRLGNVLIADFFEETNLVEVAKAWNRRDCNDAAEYRARSDERTDCRSRAEDNACADDPDFMRTNCPLSVRPHRTPRPPRLTCGARSHRQCGLCSYMPGEPGAPCVRPGECISRRCGPAGFCLVDDALPPGASCGVDNQCLSAACDVDAKVCL